RGNYWSDYDEEREGCYDTDSDGICNSPYVIDTDNQDNYPFKEINGWINYSRVSSINIATSARKIYYADAINAARTALTSTELGNILADETFTDLTGTEYDYTQTIKTGTTASAFGTSGGDLEDPALYLDVGTAPDTNVLYNYTLSLVKNLNVSDSTNVQGEKIKILGGDYVIGASSTNTTLYLYEDGTLVTIEGGESKSVEIAGTEHTIGLISTSSATSGEISVDGTSKSVIKGNVYFFPGNVVVYVKNIIHPAFAGDLRNIKLIIGKNILKLKNGQTVKHGAGESSIKGTRATITAAGHGKISGFTIQVAMKKSKEDHLAIGNTFIDPIFGGLSVLFANAVPAFESNARGRIVIDTDNNQYAYVTFTSARAGSTGEQKIAYIYDNNTAGKIVAPVLAHDAVNSDGKGYIHVLEGENAREGDWIVINKGDAGTIVEITDISIDSATTGSVSFEDVIIFKSRKDITLTNTPGIGYQKTGVNLYGGDNYTVKIDNTGTFVNITWSEVGTKTLFPRIKLKNGGWFAFLTETSVPDGTSVILPSGTSTLRTSGNVIRDSMSSITQDSIEWGIKSDSGNPAIYKILSTETKCNFDSSTGPAILFMEPKHGDYICIPLTTKWVTEIAIGDPIFNGLNSGKQRLSSNTYKSQFLDVYGTLVTKEDSTYGNGMVTIVYPPSKMFLDIFFKSKR
ncbi:MAG: hypothetical protein ABIJ23_02510, partial [Candidatus Magasanikbacteria bacterium]